MKTVLLGMMMLAASNAFAQTAPICKTGEYLSNDGRCLHDQTGETHPAGDGCNSLICMDPACHQAATSLAYCAKPDDPAPIQTMPTVRQDSAPEKAPTSVTVFVFPVCDQVTKDTVVEAFDVPYRCNGKDWIKEPPKWYGLYDDSGKELWHMDIEPERWKGTTGLKLAQPQWIDEPTLDPPDLTVLKSTETEHRQLFISDGSPGGAALKCQMDKNDVATQCTLKPGRSIEEVITIMWQQTLRNQKQESARIADDEDRYNKLLNAYWCALERGREYVRKTQQQLKRCSVDCQRTKK